MNKALETNKKCVKMPIPDGIRGLQILLASFLLFCTGCNNKLNFSKEQRALYKMYKPGDTVFFINSKNDFDSIIILAIDSLESDGGLMSAGPEKRISLPISHIPAEHWITSYNCCPNQPIPNDLITIGKSENSPDYYGVQYRGFTGELNFSAPLINAITVNGTRISKHWVLNTDIPAEHQKPESVVEIIWTNEYGLTRYKKNNGDWYTICKNKN